jgi:exopolysaccharide production protein ExoQ
MSDSLTTGAPSLARRTDRGWSREAAARAFQAVVCSLVLFVLSDAAFPLLRHTAGQSAVTIGGSAGATYLRLASFAVCVALCASRWAQIMDRVRRFPAWWLLPALAVASAWWSVDASVTARASMGLCIAMMLGAYVGVRFTLAEQLRLVGVVCIALIGLSLAFAFIEPGLGIDVGPVAGSWRGAFITKNAFGRAMAFAFTVLVILVRTDAIFRGPAMLGAVLSAALIMLSDSRTSMVIGVAMLALAVGAPVLARLRVSQLGVTLLLVAIVLVIIGAAITTGTDARTRPGDPDLFTGRPRLWAASMLMVMQHPLLGYGFQGFWNGSAGAFMGVWRLVQWTPPHAHNGFVDVTLDLGVVGLALLIAFLARTGASALVLLRTNPRSSAALWATSIVLFMLLTNLTESTFLRSNMYWSLLAAVGVALTTPAKHAKAT